MSEQINPVTDRQLRDIYELAQGFINDDAEELERQIAELKAREAELRPGRPFYLGQHNIQTPLLPVEDLTKFYLIQKGLGTLTVVREKDRFDLSPDLHEETWIELSPSGEERVNAHNSTRLISYRERHDGEKNEKLLDMDEFIELVHFICDNQEDVITDELCTTLIRQLGSTAVWR